MKACPKTGKQIHQTKESAERHQKSLETSLASVRLNVYRCKSCKGWHVGHRPGSRSKA